MKTQSTAKSPKEDEESETRTGMNIRINCIAQTVARRPGVQTFDAAKAIVGPERGQKVDEAAEKIEKDLTLVGCTGVEDKLQDGVPETIDKLAKVRPTHHQRKEEGRASQVVPQGTIQRQADGRRGQEDGKRQDLSKGAAF
jgi:hypothetical protein